MNDYPNMCVITQRMLPTNSSLLQFRKVQNDKALKKNLYYLMPDFNPLPYQRTKERFIDRDTQ